MRKVKVIDADTITVVSAYLRLRGEQTFLLESKGNQTASANYSMIALDPVHEFQSTGTDIYIDGQQQATTDPLQALQALVVHQTTPIPGLPFQGGAIGYVGFDTIAVYEDLGPQPVNDLGMPDTHLFIYETFIVFDHQAQTITIVADDVYSGRTDLSTVIATIEAKLHEATTAETQPVQLHELTPQSNLTMNEFTAIVDKTKALITAGDMFQMVPSQRFEVEFVDQPFDFYRQLRRSNPSPYMYFLDYGPYQIIGASPESLVTVRDNVVTTNPIAGTRKRSADPAHDQAMAHELQTDEKELAEHRMLVDLGRNDLGKISEYGSVHVTRLLELEKYRFVMHLVSEVQGQLKAGTPAIAALKATLPAGTVSGAPKVRALQRIYEMEPVKRGVYAGAVGYLSQDNQMDFAIAIRTMIVKDGKGYVQAGAGIVYDSIPANEYQETRNKARGLLNVGGLG
ncbi:anthranilate synthase component I [Periweissella ghanensis]|uniref:Anthranilate synthase component 1 n=1 Tax=Periweissella ghanensis TaxID=467997 RepID=A0ABM8Z9W7_9LACO|nr:anthranilate synthase component I [Periweissella ghanensis]MCM0601163.1 anthranilate synthase component I [Periweissella ghanensis]CAH0417959.1 Anthranilate synthase component 1 [Periweissella ghanensis]